MLLFDEIPFLRYLYKEKTAGGVGDVFRKDTIDWERVRSFGPGHSGVAEHIFLHVDKLLRDFPLIGGSFILYSTLKRP